MSLYYIDYFDDIIRYLAFNNAKINEIDFNRIYSKSINKEIKKYFQINKNEIF